MIALKAFSVYPSRVEGLLVRDSHKVEHHTSGGFEPAHIATKIRPDEESRRSTADQVYKKAKCERRSPLV